MAVDIIIPRLGWSMEEGVFGEWLKQEGEMVNEGDLLFVLESDKASQEIESMDAGILRIPPDAPKPGDTVRVGQLLGYLAEKGEAAPFESGGSRKKKDSAGGAVAAAATPASRIKPAEKQVGAAEGLQKHEPKAAKKGAAISPRARRLALELGLDYSTIRGSGKSGRIREQDIRAAASVRVQTVPTPVPLPPADVTGRVLPVTHIRKTIAERMLAGVNRAAPVTLTTKADATNLASLRQQFRSAAPSSDAVIPSYTDLIVKLAAAALQKHPMLHTQWKEDGIHVPDQIHIAIAVETDAGLLAPVLGDVGRLTLREVAVQSRTLIDQARNRKLKPEQMQGATFTVTNLGAYGVDVFTPIVNLPQCSILGVGRIIAEPAVVDGEITVREMVSLSLTFDHRVVDGAPAAQFLDTIRKRLEQPGPWLIS